MSLTKIHFEKVTFCSSRPFAELPDGNWHEATLPFEVHHQLASDGRIPHPYRDDTADSLAWVHEHSWWLRAQFNLERPLRDGVLRLQTLDTVGTVWLNGQKLGNHANVFRPALLNTGGATRSGPNELLVRIDPPLSGLELPLESTMTAMRVAQLMGRAERKDGHGMFGDLRTVRRRKPIVDWGWDFAPRLPSIGLGSAELTFTDAPRIESIGFETVSLHAAGESADVLVSVVTDAPKDSEVSVTLISPDGTTHEGEILVDARGSGSVAVTVQHPLLWWTNDLGAQPLYRVTARIGDVELTRRVGIRTVELDRSADSAGGKHFRFVVNGVPIFARGACVVPSDLLQTDLHRDRSLVALAADAGMTMLRVWGGGGYGSDSFYDAADERGILIWQDFPFACADYPEDSDLLEEVEIEARYQARRIGSHASLALWCGNNEVHAMHQLAKGDLAPGQWGHTYFHSILPAVVNSETPTVAYWPGSPYGENDSEGANGTRDGDRHAWEVWHGLPLGAESPESYETFAEAAHFRRYRYDTGRFISEFGIIAAPARETLASWIGPDELRLDSIVLRSHIRDEPKEKAFGILEIETGLPRDLDEYIQFTQAVQAKGLKFGIEHYRRQEPSTAGALIWQLNDPWPGISWSLIDYDLRVKPAFHVVRRAFATVAASFVLADDGRLELWVANSGRETEELQLDVSVETVAGSPLHSESLEVVAPPHGASRVWVLSPGVLALGPDVVARVREQSGSTPSNDEYFAPLKEIPFPTPRFTTEIQIAEPGRARVTISAETALYAATVTCSHAGARFDDNVIDLAPGESVIITVSGLPENASTKSLRVFTHEPLATSLTSN